MSTTTSTPSRETREDRAIKAAAQEWVNRCSSLDHNEARAAIRGDEDDGEPLAFPMWGTVFRVERWDAQKLRELFANTEPQDELEAIRAIRDFGLTLDIADCYACSKCGESLSTEDAAQVIEQGGHELTDDGQPFESSCCSAPVECDEADLCDAVRDAIREDDSNDAGMLISTGWSYIPGPNVWAFETDDGDVLLGINGAGYDFYESHWIPLYHALGLEWHRRPLREEILHERVEALAKAQKGAQSPMWVANVLRAGALVSKAWDALREGGPLTEEEKK